MGKISLNDKILIENLQIEKWSSIRLLSTFSSKGWSRSGLDSLFKKNWCKWQFKANSW